MLNIESWFSFYLAHIEMIIQLIICNVNSNIMEKVSNMLLLCISICSVSVVNQIIRGFEMQAKSREIRRTLADLLGNREGCWRAQFLEKL